MTILKDADARPAGDRLQAAGDAAERQMAFYLRRAFGDNPDVLVLNDLRLVEGDDAAQIDHLILHAAGAIVIESKSVTQKVKVNARGEWARLWDNHWRGMPSPILQAVQQAEFLRAYLQRRKADLRDRLLVGLVERGFAYFDIDILVAVSDGGIIQRDAPEIAPEALKADQIVFQAGEIIKRQRKAAGLGTRIFGKVDDVRSLLNDGELQRVADRLLRDHSPRSGTAEPVVAPPRKDPWGFQEEAAAPPTPPPPPPTPQPAPAPAAVVRATCKKCGGSDLSILYGKFGYYWKCPCGGNTAIDKTAPDGTEGRIRKQGLNFYLCYGAGQEVLFHTNAKEEVAS